MAMAMRKLDIQRKLCLPGTDPHYSSYRKFPIEFRRSRHGSIKNISHCTMSLKYVVVFSLFQYGANALPIVLSIRAEPGTEDACPVKRSLYKIVRSCVLTTIICAWVSVHPNVPPSGNWKGLWQFTSVEQMDYGSWPPRCDGWNQHRRSISRKR